KTIIQLQRQADKIKKYLGRRSVSPGCSTEIAISQIKKCAEVALSQTTILNDEIARLQETVQQKTKKKEIKRSFINSSTILTGIEARRRISGQQDRVEGGDGDTIVVNTLAKNQ
ncbi:uncharacterized protein V1513DRAFT_362277, partial [Lipomyces chichibuensis]|uniref:uncharacterized protein n=1 Tax=Lipomyces chichibuensis TaxID=1546026 RepID=UPI003343D489